MKITHKQAVQRITRWLRFTKGCPVVAAELTTQVSETPDVIAWFGAGNSRLIECKVSRSDFLTDKHKIFRRYEDEGMGDFRYYAAPQGMISPDEIPEGWGLLEITEKQVREIKKPEYKPAKKINEVKMLMSAIRRLEISTAVFVQVEIPDGMNIASDVLLTNQNPQKAQGGVDSE